MKETQDETMLFQQIEIDGTPFTAVKMDEKWFLTMGKYRLTEPTETLEEVQEEAKINWFRVMQVIQLMIEENMPTIRTETGKLIAEGLNKANQTK